MCVASYELHYSDKVRFVSPSMGCWIATHTEACLQEIHAYVPVTFDTNNFALLECTVHSCLTDVRFRSPPPRPSGDDVKSPRSKRFMGLRSFPSRMRAGSEGSPLLSRTPSSRRSSTTSPTFHAMPDGVKAIVNSEATTLKGYVFGGGLDRVSKRQVGCMSCQLERWCSS